MELTQKEKTFISVVEKNAKNAYAFYFAIGISLIISLIGVYCEVVYKIKGGFIIAILFSLFGFYGFIFCSLYKKFYSLIKKSNLLEE
jgi:hypothetical protein